MSAIFEALNTVLNQVQYMDNMCEYCISYSCNYTFHHFGVFAQHPDSQEELDKAHCLSRVLYAQLINKTSGQFLKRMSLLFAMRLRQASLHMQVS